MLISSLNYTMGADLEFDLSNVCPTLLKVEAVALAHPWFEASHPDKQPDAPPVQEKARSG